MFSSVASAGVFDWFKEGITGMNTAEGGDSTGEAPASEPEPEPAPEPEPEPEPAPTVEPEPGDSSSDGDSSYDSGDSSSGEDSSYDSGDSFDSNDYDSGEDWQDDGSEWQDDSSGEDWQDDSSWEDDSSEWQDDSSWEDSSAAPDCGPQETWDGYKCAFDESKSYDDHWEDDSEWQDDEWKKDKKPRKGPRMRAPGFEDADKPPMDEMREQYGEGWCEGGQCCPDNICDEWEQKTHGCPQDCGWEDGGEYQCIDETTLEMKKQDCINEGGNFEVHGSPDCPEPFCHFSGSGFFGGGDCDNIEMEIEKCESLDMFPHVTSSCIVQCQPRGSQGVGHIKEEIPEARALQMVLKLDSMVIKFAKLETNLNKLADFYEADDQDMAENYRNAANHLGEVSDVLSSIKQDMATLLEDKGRLEPGDLYPFKNKLRKIVDDTLTKTLYLMLGVEPPESSDEDHSMTDCKTDGICFMSNFEQCATGTTFNPEEGITVEIVNIDEDSNQDCHINVVQGGKDHFCNFPIEVWKYESPSPELFEMYCEGFEDIYEFEEEGSHEFEDISEFEEETIEEEPLEEIIEDIIEETVEEEEVTEETVEEEVTEEPAEEEPVEEAVEDIVEEILEEEVI
tara:strand:- start:6044 stop:7906 length:1863 start_codon:yes stop_codon:yes gene_type:complete